MKKYGQKSSRTSWGVPEITYAPLKRGTTFGVSSVLYGISFFFLAIGGFLVTSGIFDRTKSEQAKLGRVLLAGGAEGIAALFLYLGTVFGGKLGLALPTLIISLGFGSIAGLFHGVMRSIKMPKPAKTPEEATKTETP